MPEFNSDSISEVWKDGVELAASAINREASPLISTITHLASGRPAEDSNLRASLDRSLVANGKASVETVAGTIFPQSLWDPSKSRQELFNRYRRIYPKIRQHPKNRRGTYFQRLIDYPAPGPDAFDQLDQVISTYVGGNHRRSALQASTIVPRLDLNNARQLGFPCMHQVAFLPDSRRQTLRVIGFYPMQYLYERAYGNYLGLIRLGYFMASEMNLELEAVSCVSVVAKAEAPQRIIDAVLT